MSASNGFLTGSVSSKQLGVAKHWKMAGKQIQVVKPGEDLVVVGMQVPKCPPRGLIVKTLSSGICHSDVHLWRDQWVMKDGQIKSLKDVCDQVTWPMVLGHECCGEVMALGTEVPPGSPSLDVGDIVTVFPWVGCGKCGICKQGSTNNCPDGGVPTDIGLGVVPGCYQTYVAVSERSHVVKMPSAVSPDVACMFGCSALTAYHACSRVRPSIERAAKAVGGARFLVIGAGGLGLWCIQIARAMFPANTTIYVADIAEDKLALAKKHGADAGILWATNVDTAELIRRTTEATGGGIDGSVDFVGRNSTTTVAYESVKRGATMSVVGLCGGTFPVGIVMLALNDITVAGTYKGTRQMMEDLVQLYVQKNLKPPPLKIVRPEGASAALHQLHQGKITGRAIINFK